MAQNINENLKILQDSLEKARNYNETKNYGRSFAHYLIVFQLLDYERRQKYEKEFTHVLHVWGSILHKRSQFEDIFKCYHLATLYFPQSAEILNNLGVHALKLKYYNLAKTYFTKSLLNNERFLPAEQNLQTTNYMLVERWHYPMLNDRKRNESYRRAIAAEISNSHRDVLDIGTGTGILSLFAARTKLCNTITACDYSVIMCDIATRVFHENNPNLVNIKLLNKSSMDLVITKDLKKRATLLVTEILDSGVFGENILETLIHAWDNLLFAPPYAKCIPSAVDIYISGIKSDVLSRKIRLNSQNTLLNINKLCLTYLPIPYDTENLKHENIEYVTSTNMALNVQFNNVQQLRKLLHKNHQIDLQLTSKQNERLDAFVVWFKLHLNDEISITNSPFSADVSCWEQAIFYLHHPLKVTQNDTINIKMSCAKGYIDIIYNECISEHKCFMLPKNAILYLNDAILMSYLKQLADSFLQKFTNCSVLDLTPFPVLALLLLMQKTATRVTLKVDEITQNVVLKLCELNSIDTSRIFFVADYEFGDEKFDIISQNYINPCGLLNEEEIYNSEILKYNLNPGGVYLPEGVDVCAQLVECDWLRRSSKVSDENCCGFNIAQFINEYKSTEQRDINLDSLPHTPLTDRIQLGEINTTNITEPSYIEKQCHVNNKGCANAIFYWFKIKFNDDKVLDTRRTNSFCSNASFILQDEHKFFEINDTFRFVLKQHRGILKIYINDD